MTRIGFVLKPIRNSEARDLLYKLSEWTQRNGHKTVVVAEDQIRPDCATSVPEESLSNAIDLCVVLGGDGTMLRASAAMKDSKVPVLGINLGRLGFLSPFDPAQAVQTLAKAIANKLPRTQRMRLAVQYVPANASSVRKTALNDVVLSQGAMARLIELKASLDGSLINSYRADGLAVCTPTGSSAYNLAAGGPIMHPRLDARAITPICPQGLTSRPLVVPSHGTIRLSMNGDSNGVDSQHCMLTIDGRWGHQFQHGDYVDISVCAHPLIIFSNDDDYFDILRTKLNWGVIGPGL